jgi:hypothetical protein
METTSAAVPEGSAATPSAAPEGSAVTPALKTAGKPRKEAKDIVRLKPRVPRPRSVPPPLTFDFGALPACTLLTEIETAAALRRKPPTLEFWRTQPNHPLRWRKVGGRILYELASIREFLKGTK